MLSQCCHANIKVEFHEEYFHGCDDDYPLKVPYLICVKCGKRYVPQYTEEEQRELLYQ